MYLINLLVWSALFALSSYVYSAILTDTGMILNPWYNWLDRTIGPGSARRAVYEEDGKSILGKLIQPARKARAVWLFKPLVGCYKCVAGQFGLWGYFWFIWKFSMNYDLIFHIVFISFAIYFAKFIKQSYEWN